MTPTTLTADRLLEAQLLIESRFPKGDRLYNRVGTSDAESMIGWRVVRTFHGTGWTDSESKAVIDFEHTAMELQPERGELWLSWRSPPRLIVDRDFESATTRYRIACRADFRSLSAS